MYQNEFRSWLEDIGFEERLEGKTNWSDLKVLFFEPFCIISENITKSNFYIEQIYFHKREMYLEDIEGQTYLFKDLPESEQIQVFQELESGDWSIQ